MPLETATYIDSLVTSNPDGNDARNTADDHLRLIKAALKRTMPLVSGPISASHQAISYVNDLSASVQAQINALRAGSATVNAAMTARFAESASMAAFIGTIPASRVPDMGAGVYNIFRGDGIRFERSDFSQVLLTDLSQPVNEKTWTILNYLKGFEIRAYDEALSGSNTALKITRNSYAIGDILWTTNTGWMYINGLSVLTSGSTINATLLNGAPGASYARLDLAQSFSKGQAITQANTSGAGTLTPNCDETTMFRHVVTGSTTVATPANARSGMVITLHLIQGAGGGNPVSWSSVFKFPGGTAPTISSSLSAVDVFAFQYDSVDAVWRQAGLNVR